MFQKDTHQNLIKSESSNSLGMLSIIYHYWIHWKRGWDPEYALLMACVQVTVNSPITSCLPATGCQSVESPDPVHLLEVTLFEKNTAGRCRARALGRDRKKPVRKKWPGSRGSVPCNWINDLKSPFKRKYMHGYFVKTRGNLRTSQILPPNSTFKSWECLRSKADRTKHLLQHFCLVTKAQNTV